MTQAPGNPKPRVGITSGDPAGIGPEIVLKSVAGETVREFCLPVIVGDSEHLRDQAARLGLPCDYNVVSESELSGESLKPVILDVKVAWESVKPGAISPEGGRAAISFIESAVKLCSAGKLDAVATAPINKESLRLAGSPYPGHTEMIAALCGSPKSLMSFFAADFWVVLLTTHVSLSAAIASVKKDNLIDALGLADRELRSYGIASPRWAVAGLNPHAGENGLFGREEIDEMTPAIQECRSAHGIDVRGPYSPDTVFLRATRGEFDAVLSCFHDQGLIAVKCLAFGEAVNVTLGLPIIRTSVDHGTGFDIAGQGVAESGSMTKAIKLAARLVTLRRARGLE